MISLLFTELISVFAYPLGAALLVGIAALGLTFSSWRRVGQILLGLALFALWFAATPVCANWLTWRLESQFPPVPMLRVPRSDAVILLGGVLGQPLPPRTEADLADSADRIMEALRLYRAGKAPLIVISAGNQPWQAAVAPEALSLGTSLILQNEPKCCDAKNMVGRGLWAQPAPSELRLSNGWVERQLQQLPARADHRTR